MTQLTKKAPLAFGKRPEALLIKSVQLSSLSSHSGRCGPERISISVDAGPPQQHHGLGHSCVNMWHLRDPHARGESFSSSRLSPCCLSTCPRQCPAPGEYAPKVTVKRFLENREREREGKRDREAGRKGETELNVLNLHL